MTYAEKLQAELHKGVSIRVDGPTEAEVSGSIWAPLVDALFDVVVSVFDNCRNKFDRTRTERNAKKMGPFQRAIIRREVREHPAIPTQHYAMAHEVVIETITGATEEDVKGYMDEHEREIDWDFFGEVSA